MAAPVVPPYQVFLNFRGQELRYNFISHLEKALRDKHINVFIDYKAERGQELSFLFKEIQKSRLALAILSEKYTESDWCLDELVEIKNCMKDHNLVVFPIFYKVDTTTVKQQTGEFGDKLRGHGKSDDQMNKWIEALKSVCNVTGLEFDGKSNENEFIDKIVEAVLITLKKISSDGSKTREVLDPSKDTEVNSGETEPEKVGLKHRFEEFKWLIETEGEDETRVIGVVGMHGIGKTTLVRKFYKDWRVHFDRRCLLEDISEIGTSMALGMTFLGRLLKKLLKEHYKDEENDQDYYKEILLEKKVFIVLDGVNNKRQIEILLKDYRDWTKKGSLIVIATSDRSLLRDLSKDDGDIYEVPQLNHRDGLRYFHQFAFDHSAHQNDIDKKAFMELSEKFVYYARGHPQNLEILASELKGKSVALWEDKRNSLAQNPSPGIRTRILEVIYKELSPEQQDAFLDIACFRSHDLVYIESLLNSSSSEATTIIKALADKFLIDISDSSRVEMHDLLYTFATEIDSKAIGKERHHRGITMLKPKGNGNVKVKGIFLDLSRLKKRMTIRKEHFNQMNELRYLKFYSSHCPQECNPNEIIFITDKLDFPLEEVRCLHWLKYPSKELPPDFNPKNLVDLKLRYSKIEQIWRDKKDAPKLKWVDLNHSSKLKTLSGLPKAQNLQRLNLEGCTALKTLDPDMQNMESLVFLNLKGCTSLESFPNIKLVSLKTLILSNCSNLKSFLVLSEGLEVLYLDGTAITELPTTMVKLVKLNMQDCKRLEKLPEGFDKMKVLQELVCSGCSMLSTLPDEMNNMKCLQILLLDGTAIATFPEISSLERLCLSGNDNIRLLNDMSQLYQLKWLDLKYCKNLTSIPKLPPNLQCLDAQGCDSLKTVANPVGSYLSTRQIHSTFIFTNCNKLGRTAKKEITNYAQRKCHLLSDALKRCNESFVPEALFSTCFPGCEVPLWFCHKTVGSVLNLKLPPHWNENRFVGIALCAVVSFPNCEEKVNSCSVTFKLNLESTDGLPISFDRLVGCWNKLDKMESDHVFICYTRCSNNIKCLEDQHSGTCTPTTATLKFDVTDGNARLEVLKCGLELVYGSYEPQKTISDVTESNELETSSSSPISSGSYNNAANESVYTNGHY